MFRTLRQLPLFKLLAVAQTVLLAREHYKRLAPQDRRRIAELVRRGRSMSKAERDELRRLLLKLEPRAFAMTTAGRFSPLPFPRRMASRFSR